MGDLSSTITASCPLDGKQTPVTMIIYSMAWLSLMRAGAAVSEGDFKAATLRAMKRRPLSVINGRPC